MSLRISAYGRSHVGQVRTRNEDMMAVEPSLGLVVVADGMGGAPGGDLASSLAVQEVTRRIQEGKGMEHAIREANRKILDTARDRPAFSGMGTTLTALQVSTAERIFTLGHVGDSRAYRLARDGFSQLSRDHTMVRDMVDAGRIPASAERAHPLGHILSRALGTEEEVQIDLMDGAIKDGDCFMLCSDGLMKVLEEEEIERSVRMVTGRSLEDVVEGIVEEANLRGAPDNITVAMLSVEEMAES